MTPYEQMTVSTIAEHRSLGRVVYVRHDDVERAVTGVTPQVFGDAPSYVYFSGIAPLTIGPNDTLEGRFV